MRTTTAPITSLSQPGLGPTVVVEEQSPVGPLSVALHDGALVALMIAGDERTLNQALGQRGRPLAVRQLDELDRDDRATIDALHRYFVGDVHAIDAIAVDAIGSPFQRRVWKELRAIPVGTTISYVELARRVGQPSASRAVGRANATNPIAIVVPCHRVVRADGALGGYASGVQRKRWLLDHEERHAERSERPEQSGLSGAPARQVRLAAW
jgi:methylated-DNA-[protein]-cysteine S-methyltransferase